MKKFISAFLILALALTSVISLAACSSDDSTEPAGSAASADTTEAVSSSEKVTVAIPNDPTNEARALLLLENKGYITLKDGAGITATIRDIEDNPKNIEFIEVEAAQLPNALNDYDYAVINSNYALDAGLNPVEDSLEIEGSASAYGNVIAVRTADTDTDKTKALVAAVESQAVADYITENYGGAVISVVENPTDGYASDVDYDALKGSTISVAASPTPHAEILKIVADILAEKDITLDIVEFTDYVQPNNVVNDGEIDANYFQHLPYLEDFNAENNTELSAVSTVHVEPLGLYGGNQKTLDALK